MVSSADEGFFWASEGFFIFINLMRILKKNFTKRAKQVERITEDVYKVCMYIVLCVKYHLVE